MADKKVWAVSGGSYSDYAVYAIFSTEALAKEFLGEENLDTDYFIEEFVLDPDSYKGELRPFRVFMSKAGDTTDVYFLVDELVKNFPKPAEYSIYAGKLQVICWAKNQEHAIKITNEIRTQAIALGEFEELVHRKTYA